MNGVQVTAMKPVTVVINRGENEEPLVAICKPVTSYEAFEKLCVLPTPPEVIKKGGVRERDINNPEYRKKVAEYSEKRVFFLFLESVKGSIEWETVKYDDPETWKNCETEMKESGLTAKEIEMVFNGMLEANALNEERMELARSAFLAGQGAKQES